MCVDGSAGLQVNTRQHNEIIIIYDLRSIMNRPFVSFSNPANPRITWLRADNASLGSRSRSFRHNTNPIYSILWACSAFVTFEVGRASARILDRLPRIRDPYRLMQKDHKPSRLIGSISVFPKVRKFRYSALEVWPNYGRARYV